MHNPALRLISQLQIREEGELGFLIINRVSSAYEKKGETNLLWFRMHVLDEERKIFY